ncbi:hypothetical protein DFH27DRAFT_650327 [Peziza echinospora]|nr:hypothetical protein DFH27DRAFT_650327 [Peziza echinospora]
MALITDGSGASPFVNSRNSSDPFARLLTMIPTTRQYTCSSPSSLAQFLLQYYDDKVSTRESRLLFKGVSADWLEMTDLKLKQLGIRGHLRFTYEEEIQSLIVRLMPSLGHEAVCGEFFARIARQDYHPHWPFETFHLHSWLNTI